MQNETDDERQMYNLEKENNFRWIAALLKTTAKHTLTVADRCDEATEHQLAVWGAFAELAHGYFQTSAIWEDLESLTSPGGLLGEPYACLKDSQLLGQFVGDNRAEERGYVAYRPDFNEIIVTFSGTSSLWQVLQDINYFKELYPVPHLTNVKAKVHRGFWNVYNGVRLLAAREVASARQLHPDAKLVITGHSLGAVMCYLFCLDILLAGHGHERNDFGKLYGVQIVLAAFGSPRAGDDSMVELFRRATSEYEQKFENYGGEAVKEFSVKGYRDGASLQASLSHL